MDDEQRRRLAFASQLVLCVHRGYGGSVHNPCCVFYSVDNPDGFDVPVKVCGCRWPAWEVRSAA